MAAKNAEGETPKKSKKTLMLIAIGLVLAAGLGTTAYLVLGKAEAKPADSLSSEVAQAGMASGAASSAIGPMVDIESFVINIIEEKDSRYLKAAITLEMNNVEAIAEVNKRMPQIRDAILLLVGNKTFNEVRDLQGKLQLRVELMQKINELLQAGRVRRIYFTDFVVQ